MINHDEVALCAYVEQEQVKYYKEYALHGRVVRMEQIPYSEFVKLWHAQNAKDANEANKPLRRL